MSRYSQSPNYVARRTLWLAFDWWNVVLFTIIIPVALILLEIVSPGLCSPLMASALWMIIPFTIVIAKKKLHLWNLVFLMILIPLVLIVGSSLVSPLYVFLSKWTNLLILWMIAPISVYVVKIIVLRHQYIEFYDTFVVEKSGVFFKKSKKTIFPEVTGVNTYKNIFGYGNVHIEVVGPWDIDYEDVARPDDLRSYLVNHMLNTAAIENISNNPYIAATDGIF